MPKFLSQNQVDITFNSIHDHIAAIAKRTDGEDAWRHSGGEHSFSLTSCGCGDDGASALTRLDPAYG